MKKNISTMSSSSLALLLALAPMSLALSGCTMEIDPVDVPGVDGEQVGEAREAVLSVPTGGEVKFDDLLSLSVGAYEASGVQYRSGYLYVVFDNMSKIAKVDSALTSATTLAGGDLNTSEFEGITWDSYSTEHFYVMKEMENQQGKVVKYSTSGTWLADEWTDVTFPVVNKGFEGVAWVRKDSDDYLLGLCEANNCGDTPTSNDHGKIKVLKQTSSGWTKQGTINLPSSAVFDDYSDIALRPITSTTYKIAITSQQSSKLWIGTLDASTWQFTGGAQVYTFPKNAQGETQYCNVEGVTFLSDTRVAIVSDQYTGSTSGSGAACLVKEQMVHLFDL